MAIYLDYAATCPMPEEVQAEYAKALRLVGNPSSIHQAGQQSRNLIENARAVIAGYVGVEPMEVSFTSGGTESINTWIKGRVFAHRRLHPGQEVFIALTRAEHHATLDAVEWLEDNGFATPLWIDVDSDAVMDLDHLDAQLHSVPAGSVAGLTTLVANNEVGSLQPLVEIAQVAERHGVSVHLDAVQGFGSMPLSISELGVDALSVSAHKLGGPVGVGALVVSRSAAPIDSLIHGGGQQVSRSGTLDAAGAVAFARAATIAFGISAKERDDKRGLRDALIHGLSAIEGVTLRGSSSRLDNNVHITLEGASGEVALYLLDAEGIYVSTGSACQAGVAESSHVVLAMGLGDQAARSALRFTLGLQTTEDDIRHVIDVFPSVLERARAAGYPS